MRALAKLLGAFLVISLLVGHLLLVSLFLAPPEKLLALAEGADFLSASMIPPQVEQFLNDNHVGVEGTYEGDERPGSRLVFGVLKLRENKFMDSTQQLALNMNLLDYGEGIVGLESASQYYFKKPLSEISDKEWITLINLQKIFSKK